MAKHSYEFSNEAQNRLDTFDPSKRAQENEEYWNSLIGDAGKTDFSKDAHQRLLDAQDYHNHRLAMEARDDTYSPMDGSSSAFDQEWDAAIAENEARDKARDDKQAALDAKIASTPKLRRIQMLSRDVDELRSQTFDADNVERREQVLAAKEDKLEELLLAYENESTESPAERNEILDYVISGHFNTPTAHTGNVETASVHTEAKTTTSTPEAIPVKSEAPSPLYDELARRYNLDDDTSEKAAVADSDESLAASEDRLAMLDEADNQQLEASEDRLAVLDAADGVEHEEVIAKDNENLVADEAHLAKLDEADADADGQRLEADADRLTLLDAADGVETQTPARAEAVAVVDHNENLAATPEGLAVLDNADADHEVIVEEHEEEEGYTPQHPMTRRERLLYRWNESRLHRFFERKRTTDNVNRTAMALGAVTIAAAVAAVGYRFGWFHNIGIDPNVIPGTHDGGGNTTPPDNNHDGGTNGSTGNTPDQHPTTPDVPPVTSPLEVYAPAFNIPQASGGEDLMRRLGVPPIDWYTKVAPGLAEKFPNDFYTQQVGNFTDVRFSHPGQYSQEIEREILHRLGKI